MTSDLCSLFYKLRNITKAKRLIWYAEELCKLSICMLIFDYKLRRPEMLRYSDLFKIHERGTHVACVFKYYYVSQTLQFLTMIH